ncbi:MAG: hypothetical protein ACI9DG_001713, partial [Oleispira sp.]
LVSTFTPYPLVKTLLFKPEIMDVEKINLRLEANNSTAAFENRLMKATYLIAGSFAFSATMNYILAKWIVISPAGTPEFNEELGQLTLYSYPMIALPSMVMMMAIFYYLWRTIHDLTGLKLEEVLVTKK